MTTPRTIPAQSRDPEIRALTRDISDAPDSHIKRIVAKVDAMASRGSADALIEPLRQRLKMLRPPRPLRFGRLLFHPLDPLIVPAPHWQPGRNTIPRTALMPMANHVRQTMGQEAQAIETKIAGRTTADTGLIERLGRSLWPAAAQILAAAEIPQTWETTGLGEVIYRPLVDDVVVLLKQAVPLDSLCAETANGLLPPSADAISTMLTGVAATNPTALPMLIALLLSRLPAAAAFIVPGHGGKAAVAIEAGLEQAADRLLWQLSELEGTEVQIAAGTLADAGAAAIRIATLLEQLGAGRHPLQRREHLRALRQRLDASCKARFTMGIQEDFLAPLQELGNPPDPAAIRNLETTARGLRVLEMEARTVGSGATYDFLLRKAANTVKDSAMRDRLTKVDQIRLVEVLSGPDAATDMLDPPP